MSDESLVDEEEVDEDAPEVLIALADEFALAAPPELNRVLPGVFETIPGVSNDVELLAMLVALL
jgi:hypothetical protein